MRHSRQRRRSRRSVVNRTFRLLALIILPLVLLAPIELSSQPGVTGAVLSRTTIAQDNQVPSVTSLQTAAQSDPARTVSEDDTQKSTTENQPPAQQATPEVSATQTIETPAPTPAVTATPSADTNFNVYTGALASGWWNQSWDATINFANTNPAYAGSDSISYTATSGWAGLDLHAGARLNTGAYTDLRLAVQASQPNQRFAIFLRDGTGAALTKVPLANYGGTPPVGSWKIYTISLADLGASNITLGDIVVHEWSGKAQPAIFVDSIQLVGKPASTGSALTIYNDALASGWNVALSWDTTVDTNNSSTVYAGSKAISDTATAGWAGLQLWNGTGIDTAPYNALQFAVRATRDNQPLAIYLRDSHGTNLTKPIALSSYGGYPTEAGWMVYTIPLTDLKASNVTVSGIVIHDWSSTAQPAVFIDSIQLVDEP